MDRGAWWAAVCGVAKSRTRLSDYPCSQSYECENCTIKKAERRRTEASAGEDSLSCIGEGNGNPLQCSCLENPRDGRAWWAAVYGVTQSRTRLRDLPAAAAPTEILFGSTAEGQMF